MYEAQRLTSRWMQVELLHQDGVVAVNTVKPLREQTLTGTVTRYFHGNGTVDGDIFFTISSCCRGYRPKVGDSVTVVCVECVRQNSNWRAYDVQPNEQDIEARLNGTTDMYHFCVKPL